MVQRAFKILGQINDIETVEMKTHAPKEKLDLINV